VSNTFAFAKAGKLNGIPLLGDLVAAIVLAVRCRRADVVLINGAEYAWPRALSARTRRTTIVVWHGTRAAEIPSLTPHLSIPVRMYWWLEIRLQALALRIARHIVVGPEVAEELRRWYGTDRNALVIPNGAPPESQVVRNPIAGRLLWIGTSPFKKGLDIALEACRRLRERVPHLTLRIVGVSSAEAGVTNESWIDVAGRLPPSSMPHEYSRAEALLATTRYEGCSMAILEAMSCHVPVVAMPLLRWMLGPEALCATSPDALRMCYALEDAFSNRELLTKAVRSADESLTRFSWNSATERYARTIETCL
jgi:glycosyltransferase involved in cell wall biosynthesis